MEITHALKYHEEVMRDDIPRLGLAEKQKIQRAIVEKLTTHPESFGIPLRYSLKSLRKLRVGSYRVIFLLEKQTVTILAILPRDIVYKTIQKRI